MSGYHLPSKLRSVFPLLFSETDSGKLMLIFSCYVKFLNLEDVFWGTFLIKNSISLMVVGILMLSTASKASAEF